MHIVVVANGELPATRRDSVAALLLTADVVIAVDGGLRHCVALDRWPERLIGDLDSAPVELISSARARGVVVVEYPADKDATDLELALIDALSIGADSITVVAPFGGRLDHELATIGLLTEPRWAVPLVATDGRRMLWVVRPELPLKLDLESASTVSLLPWGGAVDGVATTGLQWPLDHESLPLGTTRGVSNIVADRPQTISISAGTLLVVADSGAD